MLGPADAFLRGLRESFGEWGDARDLEWVRSPVGGPPADLLTVDGDDGPIAGIAVSYRQLGRPGRDPSLVAMIGSAWTDPRHRSQGLFGRLVEHGRRTAGAQGAEVAVSFPRAGRASHGPLLRASAETLPCWFLRRDTAPSAAEAAAAPGDAELARLFHADRRRSRVVYPSVAAFASRARLGHPATRVVRAGPGGWAILHAAGGIDHVGALIAEDGEPAADMLAALSGTVATFTIDPQLVRAATARGFTASTGHVVFLTVPGGPEAGWAAEPWFIHNMDRA